MCICVTPIGNRAMGMGRGTLGPMQRLHCTICTSRPGGGGWTYGADAQIQKTAWGT